MLRRSVWRTSIATFCAAGLALACASTPEEQETDLEGGSSWSEPGGGPSGTMGGTTGSGSGRTSGGAAAGAVVGVQDAETQKLQQDLASVYFDYDRSTLRSDAAETLKRNAETIRSFPSWAYLTVEGHTDERGTEEYNLALGDRRADAVRRYLVTLGIPADKIRTVSHGELKPKEEGHDESAWKWNRRAEFQVSR